MIDIRNFLADGMVVEKEFSIEAKIMVWLNAGTGRVLALEPNLLAFEGRIQVMGHEKPLAVQLVLGEPVLDEQGVVTGPCTLRLGPEADGEAVYRVEDDKLVLLGQVEGKAVRVSFKADGRHTLVDLHGERKTNLRLTVG
jgi:hypothetical protein